MIMVQSEALICLDENDANWDWQGHLPLCCNGCYNDSVEKRERLAMNAWKKKCKALWLKRKWANGEQEKRSRNITFDELKWQLLQDFPTERRKEFRKRLYERLAVVSAALASAILNCSKEDQAAYKEAAKEWRGQLIKKAEDESYTPELTSRFVPDAMMQNAHKLVKGVDEFFLCRFLDCLYVCRNTQWIPNCGLEGQFCCPACGRQYMPWVQSTGRVEANKVLIIQISKKTIQEWSELNTDSGRDIANFEGLALRKG